MGVPTPVIEHFGIQRLGVHWHPVTGGLSGANTWRGECRQIARYALKAYPFDYPAPRLNRIHSWITQARRLDFIPKLLCTHSNETMVLFADRLWELTTWLDGAASTSWNRHVLQSACTALAQLHAIWQTKQCAIAPGVLNRLTLLRSFQADSAYRSLDSFRFTWFGDLLRRMARQIGVASPILIRELERWESVRLPVQPCLRDLRAEHLLFRGLKLKGIVDFGAMSIDTPAVDLARMLSEVTLGEADRITSCLSAYRRAGGAIDFPDRFVLLMAKTGLYCSAINWLFQLSGNQRISHDPTRVKTRLDWLFHRLSQFAPG